MISVTSLYRHPVKSMTPQAVASIQLTSDGRVIGDRVLGFRFRNAADPKDWSWIQKTNFVGLVNTPELALLRVDFNSRTKTLSIYTGDLLIANGSVDEPSEKAEIERSFTEYVQTLSDNPLSDHPERCPVVLVGDGTQSLFHDTAAGLVTLHGEESLAALGETFGEPDIDGRRFRSNIVVSGLSEPFEEMTWIGRNIAIGNTEFKVMKAVNRCLVTHANPVTGKRDRDVMGTLVSNFTPEKPQFAITLEAVSGDRSINLGDSLEMLS